jgi:hypothetical protein
MKSYKIYTVAIMLGDKVVKEIANVFAMNKQEAIHNAWQANDAKPFADGKHTAAAYF